MTSLPGGREDGGAFPSSLVILQPELLHTHGETSTERKMRCYGSVGLLFMCKFYVTSAIQGVQVVGENDVVLVQVLFFSSRLEVSDWVVLFLI